MGSRWSARAEGGVYLEASSALRQTEAEVCFRPPHKKTPLISILYLQADYFRGCTSELYLQQMPVCAHSCGLPKKIPPHQLEVLRPQKHSANIFLKPKGGRSINGTPLPLFFSP